VQVRLDLCASVHGAQVLIDGKKLHPRDVYLCDAEDNSEAGTKTGNYIVTVIVATARCGKSVTPQDFLEAIICVLTDRAAFGTPWRFERWVLVKPLAWRIRAFMEAKLLDVFDFCGIVWRKIADSLYSVVCKNRNRIAKYRLPFY